MLKITELRNLTIKDLDEELAKSAKDMFKIRFEVNTGSSKANHEIRKLRKYRAQIITIKKELQMEDEKKLATQKAAPEPEVKEEPKEKVAK